MFSPQTRLQTLLPLSFLVAGTVGCQFTPTTESASPRSGETGQVTEVVDLSSKNTSEPTVKGQAEEAPHSPAVEEPQETVNDTAVEQSGETPETADQSLTADLGVMLTNEGLQFIDLQTGSTRLLSFESDAALVEQAITRIYGEPAEKSNNTECPGGPLTIAIWPNGLVVNSAENKFLGWSMRPYIGGKNITTASGIGIGSTRSDLEGVYDVEVYDSTLGVEFFNEQLGGLLTSHDSDAVITNLWAGATCMFR